MMIGDKIKKLREANNMTQSELAALISTDGNTISRWERNKLGIGSSYVVKLAKILHTTTDYLLDETAEQTEIKEKSTIEVPANGIKDPTFVKEGNLIGSENVLVYEDNGRRFIFPATEKNQNWFRSLMLSSMNMNDLAMAN